MNLISGLLLVLQKNKTPYELTSEGLVRHKGLRKKGSKKKPS